MSLLFFYFKIKGSAIPLKERVEQITRTHTRLKILHQSRRLYVVVRSLQGLDQRCK